MKTMTAAEVLGIVLTSMGALCGIFLFFLDRKFKRQDKRALARQQESVLQMTWMVSASTSIREMASAIKAGRCNGELSEAVDDTDARARDIQDYLITQNAQINH